MKNAVGVRHGYYDTHVVLNKLAKLNYREVIERKGFGIKLPIEGKPRLANEAWKEFNSAHA